MTTKSSNPFDPENLAMPSTGAEAFGTRKIISTISASKPKGKEWVRVHPDPDYHMRVALLDLEDGDSPYLVRPKIVELLGDEVKYVDIAAAITTQGKLFLWPSPVIQAGRRPIAWHTTHIDAFQRAQKKWIRMTSNISVGYYDTFESISVMSDPEWPYIELSRMLEISFGDGHFVNSDDHPAVKRLLGGI